ncbi:hypothetical protein OIU85_018352 [Salix viminalis]|uniref:FLZ-type domain-containing protein n=1 Tax=Salix viminalis TaxID=40686 RepID=A0A9Q0ZIX1_SALVM|nr:hypothetical protein OIU85_018352 [Salix viminalis]
MSFTIFLLLLAPLSLSKSPNPNFPIPPINQCQGKRSRLTRSQSFGDVGLGNDRLSLGDGGFTSDNMADQSIQRIIDVSPPPLLLPEKEKDIGGGLVETEHFLERCDLCKKRLSQKQDVYMYG